MVGQAGLLRSVGGRRRVAVVAGGAGFVGSHLCERLLADGARVICLDNLQTGSLGNVAHLVRRAGFDFMQHDVVEPVRIRGAVSEIYNLACPASPRHYQLDPIRTMRTSVWGAMNLLDLARAKRARILQASTSEVYGDPDISPQAESYRGAVNTVGPRACYDEGKRAAETLFYEFGRQFGLATKIARVFNTYGPRMGEDDGRVVSNFVVQALSGEDLTVYGTGRQTRSFCYVDDLVEGLVRLMASPETLRDPVNLGNPSEFTIRELADLVLGKTGSASRMVFCELPADDPRQRRPDISRARTLLGWSPRVSLDQGLDRIIAYFADRRHAAAGVGAMVS